MHLLRFTTSAAAALLVAASSLAMAGALPRTPAPPDARAYIISPADGDVVPSTFTVKFGLSGMGVAPAGIDRPKTGHHHLLVDMEELPPLDQPMAGNIKHFGGGQTETTLTLEPGEHTLQLMLGDQNHVPHEPPVLSDKITVIVK